MNKATTLWVTLLMAWAVCLLMPSCSKGDDPVAEVVVPPTPDDDKDSDKDKDKDTEEEKDKDADKEKDPEEPTTPDVPNPAITGTVTYAKYPLLTNLNFVYPSKDPAGKTVMLSGTITMRNSMSPAKKAQGIILYNHYTVMRADECPSKGHLLMQNLLYLMAEGTNYIIVSADYYGFGETESEMQAYCIGSVNARASIDALLAARQLLAEQGYTWEDHLLNVGYSQGGQTAIAVLKVAQEEYPDLRFDRTMAGGGPYDLEETYRQYLADGKSALPSAVVNILLAYNEYFHLGIANSSMFKGVTLSHLDDWWLSKQYTSTEIDIRMGSRNITQFIADPLLDLNSEVAQRMLQALGSESLCRGWSPRKDEHIMLLHHEYDDISPSSNTQLLYDFLKQQGVADVDLQVDDYTHIGSEHVGGAAAFLKRVGLWIKNQNK